MTTVDHLLAQAERYERLARQLQQQGGGEFLEKMAQGYYALANAIPRDQQPMAGPPR